MKKYDLLRSGENIIRVLEVQGDRVLIIDCIKRTMPVWVEVVALDSYSECTIGELSEVTEVVLVTITMSSDELKISPNFLLKTTKVPFPTIGKRTSHYKKLYQ